MKNSITLKRPDDFHCHFRDGDQLARTVSDAMLRFQRVLAMPNLSSPIVTAEQALMYRDRIRQCVPNGKQFEPLMTLYLTASMSPNEIIQAKKNNVIVACKYYPAGATTNAQAGISDVKSIYPLLEAMQSYDVVLCVHGETIGAADDIFDREKIFLENTLPKILRDFPKLRVVLEHVSTKAAVEFVWQASANLAATITPHHLHYNRNDLLQGGIHPHQYCLPVLKRIEDQKALVQAAISGNPKFFLGTDSAPHTKADKESACGCAGIYSAHAAIELYAEIFEQADALDRLAGFASRFGAAFYDLPENNETMTLVKKTWRIPDVLSFGDAQVVPMKAGEAVHWRLQS